MHKVIVTDGLSRKSLSVVRSLGKLKYHICVSGNSIFTTSFWSKYTKKRIILPSIKNKPLSFSKKFISFLSKNMNSKKFILFPMEDDTLNWLSENRDEVFKYANFIIPSKESLNIAQNKFLTLQFAKKLGISIPETIGSKSIKHFLKKINFITSKYKANSYIVKPIRSSSSLGVVYLKGKTFSKSYWIRHWKKYGELIIQKRISHHGHSIGVSVLFDNKSNCVASFVHLRLQQYPNSGGPSTSRMSIQNDNLVKKSIRLLKNLNWYGVAMIEWKIDPDNNEAMLMEVNPRFWGSLELAVRSGVNFPSLYARASIGIKIVPPKQYQNGVICRWMFPGEILRYLTQKKNEKESLNAFIKNLSNTAEEWNRSDILGFISSFFCNLLLIFNIKFWKYLKR